MSDYDAWAPVYSVCVAASLHPGWFDRRPLEDGSPELVFVARKPA